MRTTKKTLAIAWNRIVAIRHLPDDQFWARFDAIEREAIELHAEEEAAIRQFLEAYAYRARKPDMDALPELLDV